MITLVEARNYRALRYVRQPLRRFEVLTGPNAAGKTTFLDVLSFLSDVIANGPVTAVGNRSDAFEDLICNHDGKSFELAVEAQIPPETRELISPHEFDTLRYEVRSRNRGKGWTAWNPQRKRLPHVCRGGEDPRGFWRALSAQNCAPRHDICEIYEKEVEARTPKESEGQ